MTTPEDKEKHQKRRRNHVAKDLRTPKYKQRKIDPKRSEDEAERRFRRYNDFEEL